MATLSEFEKLLESNISQLNMTQEIIPAKVIDIKNDFVITSAGLKIRRNYSKATIHEL